MSKYKAIFVSDIHLSHLPPALRSQEPDWYAAMARPLRELRELQKKLGGVPIICGGDVLDSAKSPAELVNFALQELPDVIYSVAGQHDLFNHNYEDIEKSAYWTLVEANRLFNIEPNHSIEIHDTDIRVFGFPWGFDPQPLNEPQSSWVNIAVVHKYVWKEGFKYLTAPIENEVKQQLFQLSGYDAVVTGDNHAGFIEGKLCNTGTFMRRISTDLQREPFVGVLKKNGTIIKHLLDTSNDAYYQEAEKEIVQTLKIDITAFTDNLLELKSSSDLDFAQVLTRCCEQEGVEQEVFDLIQQTIESER